MRSVRGLSQGPPPGWLKGYSIVFMAPKAPCNAGGVPMFGVERARRAAMGSYGNPCRPSVASVSDTAVPWWNVAVHVPVPFGGPHRWTIRVSVMHHSSCWAPRTGSQGGRRQGHYRLHRRRRAATRQTCRVVIDHQLHLQSGRDVSPVMKLSIMPLMLDAVSLSFAVSQHPGVLSTSKSTVRVAWR